MYFGKFSLYFYHTVVGYDHCIICYPQKLHLKHTNLLFPIVSEDHKSGSSVTECFWAKASSWICSQDISWDCSYLKAWPRLENLFPKWLTHLDVGRRYDSLSDFWMETPVSKFPVSLILCICLPLKQVS